MSLSERIEQYTGRCFGELIQLQIEKNDLQSLFSAISYELNELESYFDSEYLEYQLDLWNSAAQTKAFLRGDCGIILRQISKVIQKEYELSGRFCSEDRILQLFHLVVLNLSYSGFKNSQFKRHLEDSIYKEKKIKFFDNRVLREFASCWYQDMKLKEELVDTFLYTKSFPENYFYWLYDSHKREGDRLMGYFYKKYHAVAIASLLKRNDELISIVPNGPFYKITWRSRNLKVHESSKTKGSIDWTSIANNAKQQYATGSIDSPILIDAASIAMANTLMKRRIEEFFVARGSNFEIIVEYFESNSYVKNAQKIRCIQVKSNSQNFTFYFDVTRSYSKLD